MVYQEKITKLIDRIEESIERKDALVLVIDDRELILNLLKQEEKRICPYSGDHICINQNNCCMCKLYDDYAELLGEREDEF